MNNGRRWLVVLSLFFSVVLAAMGQAAAQNRQERPPEYNELVVASQIKDAAARLKEFERIKAAYPNSRFMGGIDRYILNAKIELAGSLDAVLALQKDFLAGGKGPARLQNPFVAADQILSHPKLVSFDKAAVLTAVLNYREETLRAAKEPDAFQGVPANQQNSFKTFVVTGFEILAAQAYLNAGDTAKAMAALDTYKTEGGPLDGNYFYTLGSAYSRMSKTREAYDAYLAAAADNHLEALAEAKASYVKISGKAEGFEAALEAKVKSLPYLPEPFKAPADWKGKTVLAELFTGSECPPCVAADLGFDGIIETYPAKYIAVLEYHLPIPRPDPMMNAATKKRQDYYGVNSTPMVVIDGEQKTSGGGPRGLAEAKYKEYKAAIDGRLGAAPAAALRVRAVRSGDTIRVDYDFGRAVPGAEYNVVLVQEEEKYKGSNSLMFHKMVVRDIVVIDPGAAKQTSFDLAVSEQKADQYLTDFENGNTRFRGFKFPERHHKMDRARLHVVFFAQDAATKKVLNAVVADVQ